MIIHRRMEAKYLSIVATNYKTDDSVLEFFLKIQQIFVFTECGGDDKGIHFNFLKHNLEFNTHISSTLFITMPRYNQIYIS